MTLDRDGMFFVSLTLFEENKLVEEVYADHYVSKSTVKYFLFFYYNDTRASG